MVYTAPWAAPPKSGTLATVQLVGDVQTDWEHAELNPLDGTTTYDAIGRDVRDHLLGSVPAARFQMGDIGDGDAGLDPVLLKQRFDLFDAWTGSYGIAMWKIMGNHDAIRDTLSPQEWATYMGYPATVSYAVDLDPIRVLVLNPSTPMDTPEGWAAYTGPFGVRPLSPADVSWLDGELTTDPRPTVVMNHAPFNSEPTKFSNNWWSNQTTLTANLAATDLLAVLDAHPHVIAWAHGHTHNAWYDTVKPNTGLLDLGSRSIPRIDAGATYTQPSTSPNEVGEGLAVTFYLSVLDDGRTVEVRWRDHAKRLWAAVDGIGRVHRLTAT